MNRLEDLPVLAQEALGGLTAGQDLKNRIQKAAEPKGRTAARGLRPLYGLAMAAAVVMLALTGSLLNPAAPAPLATDGNDVFHSLPAGQVTVAPYAARALLDIPPGSITLSSGGQEPEFRSVWASGNGGFPLVGVNGMFFRMMRNPSSIPDSLLGGSLGQVQEFTDEPALASADQIVSNVVGQGETVYTVAGMDSAVVAAQVDGQMRAFQRVSFANSAILGQESLGDTLGLSGNVVGLELSGVGTVTDPGAAQNLMDILLSNASFVNSAGRDSGSQSLLIALDNGMTVQMLVKNDTLYACGSWSCPEFFEAFRRAVQ